jgi:parvulin-like peptidyl-prolyl isomerase
MKNSAIALAAWAILAAVISPAQVAPAASHTPTQVAPPPASAVAVFQPTKVVARVNGAALTEADLKRAVDHMFPYEGMHGNKVPGKYSAEIRGKAMNQIVFEELVYQEAKRRKIVASAASVRDVEQQARGQFAKPAAYEAWVREGYGSVRGFERQIRRGILIAKLIDLEIAQKSHFSNARLQEYYRRNQGRFVKPESIAIQSITINIPDNPTPEQLAAARKRAQEILPKAKAAKNYDEFGGLAEKKSEDDWRVMMGDHKWIHRGRIAAAVEKVVFTLKPQQTSDIIETREALIIVRVNGYEPQKQLPFAEVKDSMRQGMEAEASGKLRDALEQRLRKGSKIEVL